MAKPRQASLFAVAIGANLPGNVGTPRATMRWALVELAARGIRTIAVSHVYETRAVGIGRQPMFCNGALLVETALPPAAVLRVFKVLERLAGRRFCRGAGGRPLDMDIIACRGQVVGRATRRRDRGLLILPHPEATRRRFVLEPLAEVAPNWIDPRSGATIRQLLARLPCEPGSLRRALDFVGDPCD